MHHQRLHLLLYTRTSYENDISFSFHSITRDLVLSDQWNIFIKMNKQQKKKKKMSHHLKFDFRYAGIYDISHSKHTKKRSDITTFR